MNFLYLFFVGSPFLRNLLTHVVKEQGQLLHVVATRVIAKVCCSQGLWSMSGYGSAYSGLVVDATVGFLCLVINTT